MQFICKRPTSRVHFLIITPRQTSTPFRTLPSFANHYCELWFITGRFTGAVRKFAGGLPRPLLWKYSAGYGPSLLKVYHSPDDYATPWKICCVLTVLIAPPPARTHPNLINSQAGCQEITSLCTARLYVCEAVYLGIIWGVEASTETLAVKTSIKLSAPRLKPRNQQNSRQRSYMLTNLISTQMTS